MGGIADLLLLDGNIQPWAKLENKLSSAEDKKPIDQDDTNSENFVKFWKFFV